ncbi:MAG: choice-of-anchor L domain-containing protein, partial [Bacteroidota bacterium]
MKNSVLAMAFSLLCFPLFAQITVEGVHPDELVKDLLKGRGIKVRNIKYTGNPDAIAKFSNPSENPHFKEGIVISTGKATSMV